MVPIHNLPQHSTIAEQIQYFENISYLGIFIIVVLSGHILPLPEDVIFLLVGYIAALHIVHLSLAILVSVLAITVADFILFFLSFHGAKIAHKFEKKIKANIFIWYSDHMKKNTFRIMFFSRFVPGLRIVSPIIAGLVKVHPIKFFVYSLISAAVYVPIIICVGFIFSAKITPLISAVESTRHILFIAFLVLVAASAAYVAKKKFFTNSDVI